MILRHLTLNTAHVSTCSRSDVDDQVVSHLLPVIDAEGGPVPGMPGWHLDFFFPLDGQKRIDGAAFFQIADEPGMSKHPVVMAICAWSDSASAGAWHQAAQSYGTMRPSLMSLKMWRDPPRRPPPAPWLAVWLTPFVAMAKPDDMRAFGDLERCVAWALIP